jgi:hypothetical protein
MARMTIDLKNHTVSGHCCGTCDKWTKGNGELRECEMIGTLVPVADGFGCPVFRLSEPGLDVFDWRDERLMQSRSATGGSVKG